MSLDLGIVIAYVLIACLIPCRDAIVALCAMVVSCAYAHSALFDMSTSVQVHLFYIITYLIFIGMLRRFLTAFAMMAMVILNIYMALDAHYYADYQTWAFNYYAANTTIIHIAIIFAVFHGRINLIANNSFYALIRNMFAGAIYLSHCGLVSCRDLIKTNTVREAI